MWECIVQCISSDNLPSDPSDNHSWPVVVKWRGRGEKVPTKPGRQTRRVLVFSGRCFGGDAPVWNDSCWWCAPASSSWSSFCWRWSPHVGMMYHLNITSPSLPAQVGLDTVFLHRRLIWSHFCTILQHHISGYRQSYHVCSIKMKEYLTFSWRFVSVDKKFCFTFFCSITIWSILCAASPLTSTWIVWTRNKNARESGRHGAVQNHWHAITPTLCCMVHSSVYVVSSK